MPPRPWRTISSRKVYENAWMRLREDVAEMPNGETTLYGVLEVGQAAGVLPFVDAEHVVLVRQYRYVFDENQRWEMPTGGLKPGESAADAARRELREEAGYDARQLEPLGIFYSSKSIMYEIPHLFIGRDLVPIQEAADETEFLEVKVFPFAEVLQMVERSEIRDAMTIIAVLLASRPHSP